MTEVVAAPICSHCERPVEEAIVSRGFGFCPWCGRGPWPIDELPTAVVPLVTVPVAMPLPVPSDENGA